ncbi:hypothetical protein Gogos_005598 [Gossypium gossypioides]|uniref:Uncharacterized protein n=1 Tax=Gossypium gossypioides TaxID=34282 RepID=A0A7J9D2U3_GOSGO|nr:hypothetical protein [Gossypium gossypioides]
MAEEYWHIILKKEMKNPYDY